MSESPSYVKLGKPQELAVARDPSHTCSSCGGYANASVDVVGPRGDVIGQRLVCDRCIAAVDGWSPGRRVIVNEPQADATGTP